MSSALMHLLQQLAMVIDTGRYAAITPRDIRAHVEAGDLLPWLKSLEPQADISIFDMNGAFVLEGREWLEGLRRQLNARVAEEYGTERQGLLFLLSMTVEQLRDELGQVFKNYDAQLKRAQESEAGAPPTPPRTH